jgi:hypothetical protein
MYKHTVISNQIANNFSTKWTYKLGILDEKYKQLVNMEGYTI